MERGDAGVIQTVTNRLIWARGPAAVNRYILLSFGVIALWYFVVSGGSDFVPEVRPVVAQTAPQPAAIATRSDTSALTDVPGLTASGSVPDRLTQPIVTRTEPAAAPAPDLTGAAEIAPHLTSLVVQDTPDTTAPDTDERRVDASSLNVRAGPSTSDGVVGRLQEGERVTVVTELDDGWTLVRIEGDGIEGWVASRFLAR